MKMTSRVFDAETGETIDTERNETAAEKKQREELNAEFVARQTAAEAKAAQRQAILDRLGLTADEAQLLLG
jgi:hypothetical protein